MNHAVLPGACTESSRAAHARNDTRWEPDVLEDSGDAWIDDYKKSV